jgi:hypothetical protein
VVPEKFPQQSFNPIPLYGFTQSFGRNHSQAGPLKIIFGHRDDKMCGMPVIT